MANYLLIVQTIPAVRIIFVFFSVTRMRTHRIEWSSLKPFIQRFQTIDMCVYNYVLALSLKVIVLSDPHIVLHCSLEWSISFNINVYTSFLLPNMTLV